MYYLYREEIFMSKTNEDYFDESHPYPGKCYKDPFWVCEHEPITLQEYADRRCISYETVRRQVKKYRADLIPHIRKVGKTQYLDDQAVEFLEEHRRPQAQPEDSQIVRNQIQKLSDTVKQNASNMDIAQRLSQEIGSLQNDNSHLKVKIDQLKQDLQEQECLYKESSEQYRELLEQYNELKTELAVSHKEYENLEETMRHLKTELRMVKQELSTSKNFQKVLNSQVHYYQDIIAGRDPSDPFKDLDFDTDLDED